MPLDDPGPGVERSRPPVVFIPEVRDYQRINAELVGLLDAGHPLVRLMGAEGQRLIASGLSGGWQATVEVEGRTGPELAAGLDANGLTIVARGPSADGAGSRMKAGRLIIFGDVGDGVGYAQSGGTIIVSGSAGDRAGLNQSGGELAILGDVGRLAGERSRANARLYLGKGRIGPHLGRGSSGGRIVLSPWFEGGDGESTETWLEWAVKARPWIDIGDLSGC